MSWSPCARNLRRSLCRTASMWRTSGASPRRKARGTHRIYRATIAVKRWQGQRAALRKLLNQTITARQQQQQEKEPLTCCICGLAGTATASHRCTGDEESSTLRFTTLLQTSFATRQLSLVRAGFACGRCRAFRDPLRFLRFAALRLGPEHPDRLALAEELCSHFVEVNQVREEVQGNPDARLLWVQEVMSRAYALHVLANAVGGWQLVGPDGQPVCQADPGQAVALARRLLLAAEQTSAAHPASRQVPVLQESWPGAQGQPKGHQRDRSGPGAEVTPKAPAMLALLDHHASLQPCTPHCSSQEQVRRGSLPKAMLHF
ncbi:hypothetical protein V8C86DRAFT_1149179 [Haematococcus lacustris]